MMPVARGAFALVFVLACVDNAAIPAGEAGGPCNENGTCNAGLACEVVGGTAKCVVVDASTSDAGGDAAEDAAVDAGPRTCPLTPTVFPCGQNQTPKVACYGATQSCTITGCSGPTDIRWECFSPNQCNSPCCVGATDAVLTGTSDCSQGKLQMQAIDGGGGVTGAVCTQGALCPSGTAQLCQANSQCPKGKICSPVQVTNGGISMNGAVVGACVPE